MHQAIADPELAPLIDRLMREEAATSLTPAPGQDLSAYADALIERFKNPALNHRLAQIAMDGSQKIPQRWLETLAFHQQQGRQCPAILSGLAAWLRHIRGDNGPVDDPMAETLKATWDAADAEGIVAALFGSGGPMASDWMPSEADQDADHRRFELKEMDMRKALTGLLLTACAAPLLAAPAQPELGARSKTNHHASKACASKTSTPMAASILTKTGASPPRNAPPISSAG